MFEDARNQKEPPPTAFVASGYCMIAGVDKFQAGNTFTPAIKRNPEAAKAV
jgi:hypothetical protein